MVGPYRNDCHGSCGQVQEGLLEIDDPNVKEGWTMDKIRTLVKYWQKYHLNDMCAGCEHQDAWDTKKNIDVYEYIRDERHDHIKEIVLSGACTDFEEYTAMTRVLGLVELHLFKKHHTYKGAPELAEGEFKELLDGGYIKVGSITKEGAGQVVFEEHPEGLLCKPCETCGYKYGTSWTRREIPQDVIDWFSALEDTEEDGVWDSYRSKKVKEREERKYEERRKK